MNIYTDESENGTLLIAAVVTKQHRELMNIMRRTRQRKLPKKLRAKAEIKASQATDKFRRYFYTHLAALQEPRLYSIYIDKTKIPPHLRGKEGLLYVRMMIRLLEACPLTETNQIYVYPDRKPLKGVSQAGFITSLKQHFAIHLEGPTQFEVYPRSSQEDPGIQVADFVAYAFYQHYERANDQWYDLLKPLIQKELDALEVL